MNRRIFLGLAIGLLLTPQIQSKVIHISDEEQYNSELNGHQKMLVEFSADWCSVCNGISKPFEEIADEAEFQQVAFAQVDVDKLDTVSKQNGIVGVPTFIYVENGTKKVEEIGVQNMPAFKDHLRENLRKTFKVAQNEVETMMAPDQPEMVEVEAVTVDVPAPAAEPNFFMQLVNGIKDFIMLIITKIQEFFMTIVDAIKGFFGG